MIPLPFSNRWPLIGMLHVPPLPGSPRAKQGMTKIIEHVLADAQTLIQAGFDGLMVENFGDAPFYPQRVPAVTVAALTAVAVEVRRCFPQIPLGINVLRNDGCSALAIAATVGANFIRVNVLSGARVTDQGLITGIAHDLLRERAALRAEVAIWADVNVKHSAALAARPIIEEASELIDRGGADAILITGAATGTPPDEDELQQIRAALPDHSLFIASGVTTENLPYFSSLADGFIVGSALKSNHDPQLPIEPSAADCMCQARNRLL